MKTILLFCCLIIIVAYSCTYTERISYSHTGAKKFIYNTYPEDEGFSIARLSVIDSFIQSQIDQKILPNAVTFIARNGRVIHNKAYGFKDMEKGIPLKKDDIFRIASQSKAVIAVGLMMLYEKGCFLLMDPVSKYIPEFKNQKVLVNYDTGKGIFETRPPTREITIHDLLTHTSGIPYDHPLYDSLPKFNSLDPIILRDVVKKIGKLPLMHDPGTKFTYGLNYEIAGYLIEQFSGMPLDKYLDNNLFKPLGMKDSYFYLPTEKADRLVTLYEEPTKDAGLKLHSNHSFQVYPVEGAKTYFSGGAGLVGTIEDYAKFCQMLLNEGEFNGVRILGRKTIEQMTINQIGDLDLWGEGDKFGLGFEIITEKGLNRLSGTIGSYKWGGMYATDYLIDPGENLIVLFYTNVQPFAYGENIEKFRVLVYQALK